MHGCFELFLLDAAKGALPRYAAIHGWLDWVLGNPFMLFILRKILITHYQRYTTIFNILVILLFKDMSLKYILLFKDITLNLYGHFKAITLWIPRNRNLL